MSGVPETCIDGRWVGRAHDPFIIAEMSGNHNGSLDRALAIVEACAGAGAHALKLQTYTADTMTIDVDLPAFRISPGHPLWGDARLYDLYERAYTPWEWHPQLFKRARDLGMIPFSSPFDLTAVEFLDGLDAPLYKIPSSEIVDLPLIRAAAATGKPLIISTGMATLAEIDAAVTAARGAGAEDVILLACTTSYPASPQESHLRGIPLLAEVFDAVAGLSDHTEGVGVAIASVALGAAVIEKHVTLSRDSGGVDAEFSLEPRELDLLVAESQRAWQALGEARLGPVPGEAEGLRFRRSLYVVADIRAGDMVTNDNVRSIRPAGGLPPDAMSIVIGRRFTKAAVRGTPFSWDLI